MQYKVNREQFIVFLTAKQALLYLLPQQTSSKQNTEVDIKPTTYFSHILIRLCTLSPLHSVLLSPQHKQTEHKYSLRSEL